MIQHGFVHIRRNGKPHGITHILHKVYTITSIKSRIGYGSHSDHVMCINIYMYTCIYRTHIPTLRCVLISVLCNSLLQKYTDITSHHIGTSY